MKDVVKIIKDNNIATVLLNRPQALNAFNMELATCFAANIISLAADRDVHGIIVSGEGRAFSAGGDLRYALEFEQAPAAAFRVLAGYFHVAIQEIRRTPKPVIAAVNGIAAGGGFSLALACDFRVMAESAVLRQAYTSNGLSIDGGGSFTLPRLVGLARALEIMAFDEQVPSEQAFALGLVTKVVKDGSVLAEATNMALAIASGSLNSFGWSKKLLTDSFDTSFEAHIERERSGLCECADHADGIEGLTAFKERRKPQFGRRGSDLKV